MTQTPLATGRLIAIGGAEDKTHGLEVLQRVVDLTGAQGPEVTVIAAASRIPDAVLPDYIAAFRQLGAQRVHALAVPDRAAASQPAARAAVARSSVIFLTGGDQSRLISILGGSPLMDAILLRHAQGAVIAGTSAGAAAMSGAMIAGGAAADALTRDAVQLGVGLGLVHGMVLDTHFLERGRFTRLMAVVAANPGILGVGVGENAGVVVHAGGRLEAIGPGHTMIVDGRQIARTNAAEAASGAAIAIEGVTMHALIEGYGYDAADRRLLDPDAMQAVRRPAHYLEMASA